MVRGQALDVDLLPETPQERQAVNGLLASMRRLRLVGLQRGCTLLVEVKGRDIDVRLRDAHMFHTTMTQSQAEVLE